MKQQNDDCIFKAPLWETDFNAWDDYCRNIYKQIKLENPHLLYEEIDHIYTTKIQDIVDRINNGDS